MNTLIEHAVGTRTSDHLRPDREQVCFSESALQSSIQHLTHKEQLLEIISIWQELWEQNGPESVFLAPEWLLTWWEEFGEDRRLCVLLVIKDQVIIGLAPWCIEYRWGCRILRTIGHGFIDYEGVLIRKGTESWVLASLQQWLRESKLYDEAVFDRLLTEPWALECDQWSKGKLISRHCPSTVSAITDLSKGWNTVLQKVGGKLRRDTSRQCRRLSLKGQLRLRQIIGVDDLRDRFPTLLQWKRTRYRNRYFRADTNIYGEEGFWGDPQVARFYLKVAERLFVRDCLAFSYLELNGEMIAALWGMEKGGIFFDFAAAFSPGYESYSVGRFHVWLLMQELCERKFTAFDFLNGDEEYKRIWRPTIRPLHGVQLRRTNMMPRLRSLAPGCIELLHRQKWVRHCYGWVKAAFTL